MHFTPGAWSASLNRHWAVRRLNDPPASRTPFFSPFTLVVDWRLRRPPDVWMLAELAQVMHLARELLSNSPKPFQSPSREGFAWHCRCRAAEISGFALVLSCGWDFFSFSLFFLARAVAQMLLYIRKRCTAETCVGAISLFLELM